MKWSKAALLVFGLAGLSACGSGDNSIQVLTQNQVVDVAVESVVCDAGPPTGQAIPGYDGALTSPLYCIIQFRTVNYSSDYVNISVPDVGQVYRQLNTVIPVNGGVVFADARLQGQTSPIIQGLISFSDISNYSGDRVSADFQLDTGIDQIQGHFSTKVRSGY